MLSRKKVRGGALTNLVKVRNLNKVFRAELFGVRPAKVIFLNKSFQM